MTVHLDISQLLLDPRRSGIQRAERELIRHWPGPSRLIPCRYDCLTHAMHELDPEIFQILCDDAPVDGVAGELVRLDPFLRPVREAAPKRLLNAELFTDADRAEFYRHAPVDRRSYWLIYDFLPWLRPEWFSLRSASRLMPYLDAVCSIPNLAFISAQTRDDFRQRIVRRPFDGPVIPMGADGLALEPQRFDPSRRAFVMLGTIEPRKNAWPVMEAFRRLWEAGIEARLIMIGTAATDAPAEIAMLSALRGHSLFSHFSHASDNDVRNALRTARAMIFPSEGEGYGIPPMEALHAGIPVIVSSTLPALVGQPSFGQIRLEHISPERIMSAVVDLLRDDVGLALWRDAGQMVVPTWADFAHSLAEWVQD